MTEHSLPSIGNAFGRNHATVMHACKTITERMKEDPDTRRAIASITQKLGHRQ
jgi:chromosomal replication initiator protein